MSDFCDEFTRPTRRVWRLLAAIAMLFFMVIVARFAWEDAYPWLAAWVSGGPANWTGLENAFTLIVLILCMLTIITVLYGLWAMLVALAGALGAQDPELMDWIEMDAAPWMAKRIRRRRAKTQRRRLLDELINADSDEEKKRIAAELDAVNTTLDRKPVAPTGETGKDTGKDDTGGTNPDH